MTKALIKIAGVLFVCFLLSAWMWQRSKQFKAESRVLKAEVALGAKPPLHYIENPDPEKVKMGEELITKGRTIGPNGKMTKVQSRYFVCTDCHNIVKEDPDLAKPSPEARLKYAVENGLPFLQGTALYGAVDRNSWYNEDYFKKYGSLVAPARDTLANAIQLCATTCSQGRSFDDWELDAVLHYLNSIGLKMQDVNVQGEVTLSDLQAAYAPYSKATFLKPTAISKREYGSSGNAENGKKIYDQACLHCHKDRGVTNYILSHDKLSFGQLKNNLGNSTRHSAYHIIRKGTYATSGYRPYMPNYTKERMSDQQLEDLVAYIKQQASK